MIPGIETVEVVREKKAQRGIMEIKTEGVMPGMKPLAGVTMIRITEKFQALGVSIESQAPPLTCERRRPSKATGTRSPPRRRTSGKLPSLRADGLRRPLPCASTPGRRHLRPSARAASLQSHDPLKRGLVAQATRALAAAPFCDRAH